MQTKSNCIEASQEWTRTRIDYTLIQPFFESNRSFVFNKDCWDWLSAHNRYDSFHAYLGVFDNELTLICVPLDDQGNEIDLTEYYTIPFLELSATINLVESVVTKTIQKATIDKKMMVNQESIVLSDSFQESAEINSSTAVSEIRRWAFLGTDWMYKQTISETNSIAQVFSIPAKDILPDDNFDEFEKHCLFSLKWIDVLAQMVMTFVVVSVKPDGYHPFENMNSDTISSNSSDFARPCPPFCKTRQKFSLL